MAPAGNTVRGRVLPMHDEAAIGGIPSNSVMANIQEAAAGKQAMVNTEFEIGTRNDGGVYWVESRRKKVLWVSASARELHVRLLICIHMGETGHRSVDATLNRMRPYCVWETM